MQRPQRTSCDGGIDGALGARGPAPVWGWCRGPLAPGRRPLLSQGGSYPWDLWPAFSVRMGAPGALLMKGAMEGVVLRWPARSAGDDWW